MSRQARGIELRPAPQAPPEPRIIVVAFPAVYAPKDLLGPSGYKSLFQAVKGAYPH
jgi:hypothetical protein